ncbi:MAG: VOC family protein [Candidatus Zophobacter franzmannii]|nr:VOC family protein [Candidatus Zophobacter franzmannii]
MSDQTRISGVAFVSVYVDDYKKAFKFYSLILGLEKQFDMGDNACFFKMGPNGLYLQGLNKPAEYTPETMRSGFALSIQSASEMYEQLVTHGTKMIHEEPMDMGHGDFWFQCYDPCGNIIEFLGGK